MAFPDSRFGDVPIMLLRRGSGPAPDWKSTVRLATFTFPGGDAIETQIMGRSPYQVEYLVRVDSSDIFQKLHALLGTERTLQVPLASTAFAGNRVYQIHTDLYTAFDNVLLLAIDDVQLRIGGTVLCRCSFQRGASA